MYYLKICEFISETIITLTTTKYCIADKKELLCISSKHFQCICLPSQQFHDLSLSGYPTRLSNLSSDFPHHLYSCDQAWEKHCTGKWLFSMEKSLDNIFSPLLSLQGTFPNSNLHINVKLVFANFFPQVASLWPQ